jgi:hypothetical protein
LANRYQVAEYKWLIATTLWDTYRFLLRLDAQFSRVGGKKMPETPAKHRYLGSQCEGVEGLEAEKSMSSDAMDQAISTPCRFLLHRFHGTPLGTP